MLGNNNEIWVFLSHSNKDYEKVRQVRDLLEKKSFRPLMFFLKCLNDDDEIDDLIKREIDSRGRFILCDSENARDSKWVKKEIDYIKSKNRLFQTINIDAPLDDIQAEIEDFQKRNSIFISYNSNSESDKAFAKKLESFLKDMDFGVYMSQRFARNDDLEDLKQYHSITYSVVRHDSLIIILSEDWGYDELKDIVAPLLESLHDSQSRIYLCVMTDGWKELIDQYFNPLFGNRSRIFDFTQKTMCEVNLLNIVNTIFDDIASSSK